MKIAHFCFDDTVGAQGAAYELHAKLREIGVDSHFFVKNKTREDDYIVELEPKRLEDDILFQQINYFYFLKNRVPGAAFCSYDYTGLGYQLSDFNFLKSFDLIHLHWISGILSVEDVQTIKKLGIPIVWTMHDFHPFTGICHYPEQCDLYKTKCEHCPQLKGKTAGIAESIFLKKQSIYANGIYPIVSCQWMEKIVKESKIFKEASFTKIPIGINTDDFVILDKKKCRQELGIQEDEKIILIGAQSVSQNVKGYPLLFESIEKLSKDDRCKDLISAGKLKILSFGNNFEFLPDFPIETINLGFISNREQLVQIYNCADVYVFPSIQETFGMTSVESMACGTPVVSFDKCAMKEVIVDGINGYKATNYEEMAEYILDIIQKPFNRELCRNRVIDYYSLQEEAQKIKTTYKEIIRNPLSDFESSINIENVDMELDYFAKNAFYEIAKGIAPNQTENGGVLEYLIQENLDSVSYKSRMQYYEKKGILVKEKKIILYGSGYLGQILYRFLTQKGYEVSAYWDSDSQKWGKNLNAVTVQGPCAAEIIKDKDEIIIISSYAYKEIERNLIKLGYEKNKHYI